MKREPDSTGRRKGPREAAGVHPRHYQKLEEGSVNVTIGTLERLSRGSEWM